MRIGILGRGKLAAAFEAAVQSYNASGPAEALEVAWSIGRDTLPPSPVEAALDASSGQAVKGHIEWALGSGTALAIGATGWDSGLLDGLDSKCRAAGTAIMTAPNFSLGIALCRVFALALGGYSKLMPGAEGGPGHYADLSVFERHHRTKADSPSGTAKLLAGALAEGAGLSGWAVSPAPADRVPVASLREGEETGYHELRLESDMETIVISHAAKSRLLFGTGALQALLWLKGRKGLYSFDDMAADIIGPLFEGAFETRRGEPVSCGAPAGCSGPRRER